MNEPGFLHLNLENTWPNFTLEGLVKRGDGALTLAPLQAKEAPGQAPLPVEALAGPASIGIDAEGNLYVADPARHRVLVWDVRSGQAQPLPPFDGFLFSIGLHFRSELEQGSGFSQDFLQEFENHEISLSEDARVTTEETGRRWRIEEEDQGQAYVVWEGEALNIYGPPSETGQQWEFLFSIGLHFRSELEQEQGSGFSQDFLREFEDHGISLSEDVRVTTEETGRQWQIEDKGQAYVASKGAALSVYSTGEGSLPGQLKTPGGVFVGPGHALYVADSGNHRVQIVDLRTMQLRAIWGQPDAEPGPSPDPGRFDEPWDLAADRAGHVYVVDHGNARVQKFHAGGRVLPAFWERMQVQPVVPEKPTYVATLPFDEEERLLVLDGEQQVKALVYHTDGWFDSTATAWWEEQLAETVFVDDVLYVGDAEEGRLLTFDRQGQFISLIQGYPGPVAGLSLDRRGRLLIRPGGGGAFTPPVGERAYVETGTFLAGPFEASGRSTRWQRIEVLAGPLPAGAHVRFRTMTTDQEYTPGKDDSGTPVPVWSNPETGESGMPTVPWSHSTSADDNPNLAPIDTWRAAPDDAFELLTLNEPARYLWIAGVLEGDGTVSPIVHQMRVEYDHETWPRYLPAIYKRNASRRVFLERCLALFESLLEGETRLTDDLPRLFDPGAASGNDAPHSWLDWLAGWVALTLHADLDEPRLRDFIARAASLYRLHGTKQGLEALIRVYLGPGVTIDELNTPFQIGDKPGVGHSTVGVDTLLDGGAPHFFRVRISLPTPDPEPMRKHCQVATAVINVEKPAHTHYALDVEAPTMQIDVHSTIDEDTLLG